MWLRLRVAAIWVRTQVSPGYRKVVFSLPPPHLRQLPKYSRIKSTLILPTRGVRLHVGSSLGYIAHKQTRQPISPSNRSVRKAPAAELAIRLKLHRILGCC